MLQGLRTAADTWQGRLVLAVVMGVLIIAFGFWGIGPIFQGFGQNRLATVGGTEISVPAYRNAYQAALRRLEERTGKAITNDQARLMGLDRQVLGELLTSAVLDQAARSLGLAISDQQIVQSVMSDPAFRGPDGKFSHDRFLALLHDAGYSEQSFIAEQRHVYLRRQIEEAIGGAMVAPRAGLDQINRYRAEERSIDYIVLPPKSAGEIAAPSEDELKKYFEERKQAYRAPEFRKLNVLAVTPTTLAKPDAVSDQDIANFYDQVKAQRYETPEKRGLQQIVFPSEAEAKTAYDRIKSGTSFETVATERKLQIADIDLGTKTKAELVDKNIAAAAFSLPEGAVSEPIKSPFGSVLVHVTKIIPGATKPLAEVAPELRAEIARSRAGDEVAKLHDKIEELRSQGKSLAEAAKAVGLQPRIIEAVDASGHDPSGQAVPDIPAGDALLRAAFASDVGVDNDTVETSDHGYAWFEVLKVDPAHDRTFDEVKAQVENAWRSDETAKRLSTKAADLVKKIDGGETLQSIAATEGLEVKSVSSITRAGSSALPEGVVAQVFNLPNGAAGSAAGEKDSRYVFKITASTVPPLDPKSGQGKLLADQYAESLSTDLMAQYVAKAEAAVGISINQDALRAAISSGE